MTEPRLSYPAATACWRWVVLGGASVTLAGAAACASDRPRPTASESTPLAPAVTDACFAEAVLDGGIREQRLTSGGIERRFLVLSPRAAPGVRLPVVFNLHGSGSSPEGQLATSRLSELAEAERFVMVAPAAVGARWNVPPAPEAADDVRFIGDILDALPGLVCMDPRRVYATGFSGGGRMSSQLACDLSTRLGAIAAVGGIRFPGPCASARSIPVLAIHGSADTVNPYAGGGAPYWGTGVDEAIEGWARHNGRGGVQQTELAPGVWRVAFDAATDERDSGDVVLYRLDGVEHVWPARVLPAEPRGTTNQILWDFFLGHPFPEAK